MSFLKGPSDQITLTQSSMVEWDLVRTCNAVLFDFKQAFAILNQPTLIAYQSSFPLEDGGWCTSCFPIPTFWFPTVAGDVPDVL
jgi:hypothetical protein